MVIKELTNQEFKKFTNNYKSSSLYQTPEYGFVMNEEKYDTIFLGLVDNDTILAASLILIKNKGKLKYAYAPRGFLIDYSNYALLEKFTLLLKKYLSKIGVVAIKINPPIEHNDEAFNNLTRLKYRHLGYNNFFEGLKPRYEAIIKLNKPYYDLFKDIKKEFRTKIRGAEKLGIKIYKGKENELKYLYNQTEKKYPRELVYYKNVYNFFKDDCEFYYAKLDTYKYLKQASDKVIKEENKNKILKATKKKDIITVKMEKDALLSKYKEDLIKANKLVNNYPDGIILATCLIVKNKKEIYLLMDGYNKRFKSFNAKHILIWKLIEKFSKEGYKVFNLGGIPNPDKYNPKYEGLKEFKLSFNVKVKEYIGDFELVTNKALYLLYKK